jgi:transmembrane sensor
MFQVAHDRKRPFVVETPIAAVTAVGTAFNIDIGSTAVTLNVTEGVVRVNAVGAADPGAGPDGSEIRVAVGQRLRMSRVGSRLLMVQTAAPFAPAWQDGRLEYRDEPLRSVIDDVNRYANHAVVIADPDIGALTYTGSVKLDAADAWVMSLPEAFPIRVEVNAAHQLTLKEKDQKLVPLRSSQSS